MKKKLAGCLALLWISGHWLAAASNVPEAIGAGVDSLVRGYYSWDGTAMKQARDILLSAEKRSGGDGYARYHVAYADYLLTLFHFGSDKQEAARYLQESLEFLKPLAETRGEALRAEACALYASALGFALGLGDQAKEAPILGPRIEEFFAIALREGKANPRVHLLRGISLLYTPDAWGGGVDKAAAMFAKALVLFGADKPAAPTAPRWGHEEAHYYMAWVSAIRKDMALAERHLQEALKINPHFGLAHKALAEWKETPPSLGPNQPGGKDQ